jgi:hypothetical protein
MRRSFRTHRLCAIPGVSPRAGMRCPVGALQTPHLPASAGPDLRSPVEALIPSASPGIQPPQNSREHPGVCGVPSERSGCAPYPGFHPGLVCGAPLGHSKRLTYLRAQDWACGAPAPTTHPRVRPSETPKPIEILKARKRLTRIPRSVPPNRSPRAAAGPGRSEHWKRSNPSPRAQRESLTLPRASLRAQARSRGAPSRH